MKPIDTAALRAAILPARHPRIYGALGAVLVAASAVCAADATSHPTLSPDAIRSLSVSAGAASIGAVLSLLSLYPERNQ